MSVQATRHTRCASLWVAEGRTREEDDVVPVGAGLVSAALVTLALLGGCTYGGPVPPVAPAAEAAGAASPPGAGRGASVSPTSVPLSITMRPAASTRDVPLGAPVTVVATGGRLIEVQLRDDRNRILTGWMSLDGSTWTATGELRPAAHYRMSAHAVDSSGHTSDSTADVATVAPNHPHHLDLPALR